MTRRHELVRMPRTGTYGIRDRGTGQVRAPGLSKADAVKIAKSWNKNEPKGGN